MQPEFMSLSDCKFITHPRQIMELPIRHQNCEGSTPSWQWFSDHFIAYQQKMRSGVKQGVKAVLEDMELDTLRSQKSRELVIQTMEEHDLLCLLPCVVPGYALLLRKWGTLEQNFESSETLNSSLLTEDYSQARYQTAQENQARKVVGRTCPATRTQRCGTSHGPASCCQSQGYHGQSQVPVSE